MQRIARRVLVEDRQLQSHLSWALTQLSIPRTELLKPYLTSARPRRFLPNTGRCPRRMLESLGSASRLKVTGQAKGYKHCMMIVEV